MTSAPERCPVCNTPDELVANLLIRICRACADEYDTGREGNPVETESGRGRFEREKRLVDSDS